MSEYDDDNVAAERVKKQRELEQQHVDDICFVMDSEQGRRVVWSVMAGGHVFGAILPGDVQTMAFMEGQRNLALALFQRVMTSCPELYLKMAAEASEQES